MVSGFEVEDECLCCERLSTTLKRVDSVCNPFNTAVCCRCLCCAGVKDGGGNDDPNEEDDNEVVEGMDEDEDEDRD